MSIITYLFGSQEKGIPHFLNDFCSKMNPNKKDHLQKLYHLMSGDIDTKMLNLIKIFGRIQEHRISQSLESRLSELYQSKITVLTRDFTLILKYNLHSLKKQKIFKPLPLSSEFQYSWYQSHHFLNVTKDHENARFNVTEFLFSSPMPLEMAKAMSFYDLPFLKENFSNYAKKIKKMSDFVFGLFENQELANENFPQGKKFVTIQLMLMRHAACMDDSGFKSWIDEILNWGSSNAPQKVNQVIRHFKLCHVVGITASLVLQGVHIASKPELSFKKFLTDKTIAQIDSLCPLPDEINKKLFEMFAFNEEHRRIASFYYFVIKDLFSFSLNKNALLELIDLAHPSEKDDSPLSKALNLLKRLTVDKEFYNILSSITYVFYADFIHHFSKYFLDQQKKDLLSNIYIKHTLLSYQFNFANHLFFTEFIAICPSFFFCKIWYATREEGLEDLVRNFLSRISIFQKPEKIQHFLRIGLSNLNLAIPKDEYPEVHRLLKIFLYYFYFSYFIELNEEGKVFVIERLLNSTYEEQQKFVEWVEIYTKGLPNNKNPKEFKRERLFKLYNKYYADHKDTNDNKPLNEWLESLENLEMPIKLIESIEAFISYKIPLDIVLLIILYPIHLLKIFSTIAHLKGLRQKLDLSLFFLPQSLVTERYHAIDALLDPEICTIAHVKGEFGSKYFNKIAILNDIIQASVMAAPAHIISILETSSILFPTIQKTQVNIAEKIQNTLCFLSSSTEFGVAYLINWIQSSKNGFPLLELTLLRSISHPESISLRFHLEISTEVLFQESFLHDLFNSMLTHLGIEILTNVEKKIFEKEDEEEEFQFYLSSLQPLRECWKKFIETTQQSDPTNIGLKLFRFIKQLKISSRQTIARLSYLPSNEDLIQDINQLVAKGNIYPTTNGYSLLPPLMLPSHVNEAYYLNDEEWRPYFAKLSSAIQTKVLEIPIHMLEKIKEEKDDNNIIQPLKEISESNDILTIQNSIELKLGNDTWHVDVVYDPLLITQPLKQEDWAYFHQVTFILKTPNPIKFSIKYKSFIQHSKLSNMLAWQFLKLKSRYFEIINT